jgi:iron complex transport system permease protein
MSLKFLAERKRIITKDTHHSTRSHFAISSLSAALILLPIAVFLFSICIGRYTIPLPELVKVIADKAGVFSSTYPETLATVLFQVRLPRIIAAMLVGASLSLAGAS